MLDLDTNVPALRDEAGGIRAEFVERVAEAIAAGDVDTLRALVGELHEADLGALIEALAPDERPRLVELLGLDFDFSALTEIDDAVREEILEELPPQTVAQGVRELDSDDAVAILEGLAQEEQAEILDQLPPPERVALARSLEYPEESAGRRMQTDFIAVSPAWTVGQAIDYLRETEELPERFYEALCGGRRPALPRRRAARPALTQQAAGAGVRIDGRRAPPRARYRGSGGGGAAVPALRPGGGTRRRWQ